jgi:hypothetical protein
MFGQLNLKREDILFKGTERERAGTFSAIEK